MKCILYTQNVAIQDFQIEEFKLNVKFLRALAQFEFPTSFLPSVMFDWDSQKDFLNADARVERCTSDMLFQPDYEQNLAVVDILNEKPSLYANSLPSMASPHPSIPNTPSLHPSSFTE